MKKCIAMILCLGLMLFPCYSMGAEYQFAPPSGTQTVCTNSGVTLYQGSDDYVATYDPANQLTFTSEDGKISVRQSGVLAMSMWLSAPPPPSVHLRKWAACS